MLKKNKCMIFEKSLHLLTKQQFDTPFLITVHNFVPLTD